MRSPGSGDANALLVVSGPTASGKTALSIELAAALRGEILNLDSVQVYRGLDIGSAKVTRAERQGIAHHLLDIREVTEPFNVAEYVRECDAAIAALRTRGVLPVLAGGTTMYLTALLHGLVELPPGSAAIRATLAALSNAEVRAQLEQLDPARAAQLHPADRVRNERALESVLESGERASERRQAHAYQEQRYRALMLIVVLPREVLYQRIEDRARQMVEAGLLHEVKQIAAQVGFDHPALGTIGYAQAVSCLKGESSESQLASEIALHTRRLAKRQMTYWRNEPGKRGWICRPQPGESSIYIGAAEGGRGKGFPVLSVSFAELAAQVRARLASPFGSNEVWYLDSQALSR